MKMWDTKHVLSVLKKSVAVNSQPTEQSFPELPTVLIWIRFVLAILYGWWLGTRQRQGAMMKTGPLIMLIHNLNLIAFIPTMYCRLYLGTKNEVFSTQILFSGLFQALALSLLIWIYLYTAQHETEEMQLATKLLLHQTMGSSASGGSTEDTSDPMVAASASDASAAEGIIPPPEETIEFEVPPAEDEF